MPRRPLYARRSAVVTLSALLLAACASAHAQEPDPPPCAACVLVVVDPVEAGYVQPPLNGLEFLVRTAGPRPDIPADPDTAGAHAVQRAADAIRHAGGRAGFMVRERVADALDAASLATASRVLVDLSANRRADDELVFSVRTTLSELRGAAPQVPIGIAGSTTLIEELLAREVAPYLDFTVQLGPAEPASVVPGAEDATVIGVPAPAPGATALPSMHPRWLLRLPADADAARRTVVDVARAAPLLTDDLVPGGTADVRCGDERQRTYLDTASLDTIAVVRDCRPERVTVVPADARGQQVVLSSGTILVRVPPAEEVFMEGVSVVAARALTAREVIARHQAAAARQRRDVRTLVSSGTMTLTFEAPGFPAPMTITAETVVFTSPDRVEIEQRDIRVNGIAFQADGVPRLPLLEPERVASPPLAITLTERYGYSLQGLEEVEGVRCHVVAFAPRDARETLFAGRAWIAADTYALVRVAAVQTGLRGSIVQSEQIDEFAPQGDSAWLLARSDVRQMYEGAGHRTPIHRVMVVHHHEVNPPDFEARRQAAYASSSVMLRDTAEGFRYLERGQGTPEGAVRALSRRSSSVRTVALGVVVDPNITRPLPFAGLSYVDFDLFGTGGQLNGFFGGTFGQLAVSLPSIGGTRWKAGGRAFAIATSYHDRAFAGGREIYAANLLQRPAHASFWLLRPLSRRVTLRAGYELEYTHFAAADSTGPAFAVPAAQVAHALRVAAEGQWRGLDGSLWWSGARRAGWRGWGGGSGGTVDETEAYDPAQHAYQRFGVAAGRSWIASPRLVGRVELAWMDGRDLDRFSRYTFGTFDNRLRGYPAALIRYDRGAVLRTSVAWAVGRALRVDGFADTAYVRDRGFGRGHRAYSGTGGAVELPGPAGTLLGVEWGYGFQGVNTDGTRGTHVVRISAYKMF